MAVKEQFNEIPDPQSIKTHELIGDLLQKRRLKQGQTLEEKAQEMGLDPAVLRRMETGGFVNVEE